METWKVPVCWTMAGVVSIEAATLDEAIEIARDDEGIIPIPDNGTFLEGSWEVDCTDVDYLREYYNGNQMDNKTMTEEMYEELKRKVFDSGVNAIEDLLGYELEFDTDKDMNEAMDDALYQMPEENLMEFYHKYCKCNDDFKGVNNMEIKKNLTINFTEEDVKNIIADYLKKRRL